MNEMHEKHCVRCFSFKGIIVGAIVAFGLIFLFNLLTVGGGLSAYTKTQGGLEALVFIAYLWVVVGSFLMLFIAGLATSWVAHHQSDTADHRNSILYGFSTWVLYILISLVFLSHATETTIVTFPKSFLSVSQEAENTAADSDTQETYSATATGQENAGDSQQLTNPQARKEAHKIGLATLASFFIFFVEALGCCFGAWCAMELNRKRI